MGKKSKHLPDDAKQPAPKLNGFAELNQRDASPVPRDEAVDDYLGQIRDHLRTATNSVNETPHLLRALLASNLAILTHLQAKK